MSTTTSATTPKQASTSIPSARTKSIVGVTTDYVTRLEEVPAIGKRAEELAAGRAAVHPCLHGMFHAYTTPDQVAELEFKMGLLHARVQRPLTDGTSETRAIASLARNE
jgi:hypothetical protein